MTAGVATGLAATAAQAQTAPARPTAAVTKPPVAPVAAPTPTQPEVVVRSSVDRTAIWVADHVNFIVELVCRKDVDVLDDDLAREKLKLDGLEVIGSESTRETAGDGTTTHRYRFELTTYKLDGGQLRVAPLNVRFYVKRPGQRLQDAAPAGEVVVPGAVVSFRSMLPDEQESYDLRDRRAASVRAPQFALAYPAGLGMVIVSFAPALFWVITLVVQRGRRVVKRSSRQVQKAEQESLEAVRLLDLSNPDVRREAFSKVASIVRGHLLEVGSVPGPALTSGEVAQALSGHRKISADVVARLLASCDVARYGPSDRLPSADACRDAIGEAEQLLGAR